MPRSGWRSLRRSSVLVVAAAALAAAPVAASAHAGDPAVPSWGGAGRTGQLGNGTLADSLSPSSVTDLVRSDVDQMWAGGTSSADSFALARTGTTVKSWGHNSSGQLGNSSTESATEPVDVDWVEGVSDIEAGAFHNYVTTSDSHVWGWGNNQYGRLLESDEAFDSNVSRTTRTAPVSHTPRTGHSQDSERRTWPHGPSTARPGAARRGCRLTSSTVPQHRCRGTVAPCAAATPPPAVLRT
ncbi:hypothetical protein [Streptomyces sp. NPDC026092]|uniref:hypothetical protein n=1 Tax=Streptomyces sp. NPDC026092 TaxID=3154797 RepID=UPI0033F3E332